MVNTKLLKVISKGYLSKIGKINKHPKGIKYGSANLS